MFAFLEIPSAIALVTACAGLLMGVWLTRWWARWQAKRRMRRLRRLGERGEARADRLLRAHGYEILERQVTAHTEAIVDDEPQRYPVRADAMVGRDGRRYVAEVKGGFEAANVANRTTRRQLLEYALAFDADGVVLVDAARDRVHTVEFPALER